ncbi:MAG: type IV secretory system conjugative DNA transfer family protein, partial [Syntrophales bacterium]
MDGFPDAARTQGVAIFGKTGYGKSTLLQGFLEQSNHVRCFVFDPHGELTRNFLEELAELNPGKQYATLIIEPDMDYPFGLNIFECQDPSDQMEVDRVTDNVIRIFKKLWGDNPAFQPRMEHILLNVSKTLIANNLTMAEIPALLHDPQYRKRLVANVKNPVVVDYWRQEYEEIARRPLDRVQYIEAVSNRISQFLSNGFLYRVVSQAKSTLLFREWLEEDKWRYKPFLVRLPMGRLGEGVTNMLGSLILAALTNAIFARYNHMENPPRVHVLIDEWHRFYVPGLSGAVLLREGRKFNVGTVLTTQTIANLGSDEIDKQSVLQCGTLVCFALTGDDAELLAKQMQLPDPTGDYRQEPVIIPSPHAAQDIYTKGHPNERIMEIRKRLIVPLYEFLAKSEEEEKWLSHFSIVDKETEDYWTRTWGDAWGYRADHAQVELAVRKLNEYLYKCMQGEKRHFDPDHHKNYDREAFDILYPLRGFLGTHQAWMRHDNPRMM